MTENLQPITVAATIKASREKVSVAFTEPAQMTKWNYASSDWHSPRAEADLRVGGKFNIRMEAKDGSQGFDFAGVYTAVKAPELIEYEFGGRRAQVTFAEADGQTTITTTFDPETENSPERQRAGWQAIINNFKNYVEG